jgi:hypothetical protein
MSDGWTAYLSAASKNMEAVIGGILTGIGEKAAGLMGKISDALGGDSSPSAGREGTGFFSGIRETLGFGGRDETPRVQPAAVERTPEPVVEKPVMQMCTYEVDPRGLGNFCPSPSPNMNSGSRGVML